MEMGAEVVAALGAESLAALVRGATDKPDNGDKEGAQQGGKEAVAKQESMETGFVAHARVVAVVGGDAAVGPCGEIVDFGGAEAAHVTAAVGFLGLIPEEAGAMFGDGGEIGDHGGFVGGGYFVMEEIADATVEGVQAPGTFAGEGAVWAGGGAEVCGVAEVFRGVAGMDPEEEKGGERQREEEGEDVEESAHEGMITGRRREFWFWASARNRPRIFIRGF